MQASHCSGFSCRQSAGSRAHRLQESQLVASGVWHTLLVAPRLHEGSFQTRGQTHIPCIGRRIFNHWTHPLSVLTTLQFCGTQLDVSKGATFSPQPICSLRAFPQCKVAQGKAPASLFSSPSGCFSPFPSDLSGCPASLLKPQESWGACVERVRPASGRRAYQDAPQGWVSGQVVHHPAFLRWHSVLLLSN